MWRVSTVVTLGTQDSICREALESLVHLVAEGNPKAQAS